MAALISACAPAAQEQGTASQPSPGPRGQKTLTIAIPNEPAALALPIVGAGSSIGGTDDISLSVHHRLVTPDEKGTALPMLAAEIPSREKGSWLVRPDGTMQVTFRLRDNVTWHDGTPLTAQ